jgi:hypothetical protein
MENAIDATAAAGDFSSDEKDLIQRQPADPRPGELG